MTRAIHDALSRLASEDATLFETSAHELAVVHRFGVYLEDALAAVAARLKVKVDADYDRHGKAQKILPARDDRAEPHRFRPDLVVHRRLTDSHNLLAVEWKKGPRDDVIRTMEERIGLLVDPFGDYGYELGAVILSTSDQIHWRTYEAERIASTWRKVAVAIPPARCTDGR